MERQMASFVETAVLMLDDRNVVSKINRINAALRKMQATANAMRNMNVNMAGLAQAERNVARLNRSLNALRARRVTVNVTANTSAAQAAINALTRPRTVRITTTTTDSGPRPRNTPPSSQVLPQGPTRMGNFAGRVTAIIAAESISRLASAIASAIKQGARDADVADTKLDLRQLPAGERSQADTAIRRIGEQQRDTPSGALLNDAQRQSLFSEALGVTAGDIPAAEALTRELENQIKVQTAAGRTMEQAMEDAISFAKAGESAGRLTTPDGKFDQKLIADWFVLMRQAAIKIGKEFTGEFTKQAVKYARNSKYAMDDASLIQLFLANEESGSTASVGWNQLIKQLSGERIQKKQLNNLRKYGLITTEQAEAGRVGGLPITEVVGGGAVDEDGLRTNSIDWIGRQIIPLLQREGFIEGDIDTPEEIVNVSKFAGSITSTVTATDMLTQMILQYAKLQRDAADTLKRDARMETLEPILDRSSTLGVASFRNQFEGLMGQVINNLEPVLLPAMQGAADTLASLAAMAGDKDATFAEQALAFGAAGATMLPIGLAAGFQAMMDPATAPLGAAGVSLTASAAALMASAAALRGAAAAQGFGGGLPDGGKGKGGFGRLGLFLRGLGFTALGLGAAYDAGNAFATPESTQRHYDRMGEREGGFNRWAERLIDAVAGEGTASKWLTTQDELDKRNAENRAALDKERKRASSEAAAAAERRRQQDEIDMKAIRLMNRDDERRRGEQGYDMGGSSLSEILAGFERRQQGRDMPLSRIQAMPEKPLERAASTIEEAVNILKYNATRRFQQVDENGNVSVPMNSAETNMLTSVVNTLGTASRVLQAVFGINPNAGGDDDGGTETAAATQGAAGVNSPVALQTAVAQGGIQGGTSAAAMIQQALATGASMVAAQIQAALATGVNVNVNAPQTATANTGARGPK
jgi:hypothetical protein